MDDKTINSIFNEFIKLLDTRFSQKVFSTEDSIRYTFFHILTEKTGINPHEVILEYPHPQIPNAEIDTFIPSRDKCPPIVLEFKFHRKIPSGKNSPKPQKAGMVFSDIFRLARFKSKNPTSRCYLVYVSDNEMVQYFRKETNHLTDFFDPKNKLIISEGYVRSKSTTFEKAAGTIVECVVNCVLSTDFKSKFSVRIYEILME